MFGTTDQTQQTINDPAMLDSMQQSPAQPATSMAAPQFTASQPTYVATPTTTPVMTTSDDTPVTTDATTSDPHAAHVAEGFSNMPVSTPTAPQYSMPTTDDQTTTSAQTPSDSTAPPVTPVVDEQPVVTAVAAPVEAVAPPVESTPAQQPIAAADQQHLAGLKQQALDHLENLTDHIDGTPEETFKTTMMMIQANDNHKLLEKALEAAKLIEDDKTRAQAMLDIINEINYFAQTA